MEEKKLVRANKVTVKVDENGRYVADFYRTHKKISTVADAETGWEKPADSTKTGERESFRGYVIKNAEIFGIEWKPEDMRDTSNVRLPKYAEDAVLMAEALAMVVPDINEMISKCKYGVVLKSTEAERITPKTKTSKGILLSGLGIEDGRYKNSGNWAWADIEVAVTMEYKEEEIYYTALVELVSGQLKKPKLTITTFNEYVKGEIVNAGLATADELDPPKEVSKPEAKEVIINVVTPEPEAQPEVVEESEFVEEAPKEEVIDTKIENKSGRQRRVLGKK